MFLSGPQILRGSDNARSPLCTEGQERVVTTQGGSLSGAYAVTGDPLAQEPYCIYQPRKWQPKGEGEKVALCRSDFAAPLATL